MCRFLDAGMTTGTSRSVGRRPKTDVAQGTPTCAVQQVGSYMGYPGRAANVATMAVHDP